MKLSEHMERAFDAASLAASNGCLDPGPPQGQSHRGVRLDPHLPHQAGGEARRAQAATGGVRAAPELPVRRPGRPVLHVASAATAAPATDGAARSDLGDLGSAVLRRLTPQCASAYRGPTSPKGG